MLTFRKIEKYRKSLNNVKNLPIMYLPKCRPGKSSKMSAGRILEIKECPHLLHRQLILFVNISVLDVELSTLMRDFKLKMSTL